MMAAHAVSQMGHEVEIWDKNPDKENAPHHWFYLHSSCDLLLDRLIVPQTILGGVGKTLQEISAEYSKKVYGDSTVQNSIERVYHQTEVIVFNGQQAIERLWDIYGNFVEEVLLEEGDLLEVLLSKHWDGVISTIPAPSLFSNLNFESREVWIKKSEAPSKEAFIFYNINRQISWSRCTAMFSIFTQEFVQEPEDGSKIEVIQKVVRGDKLPEISKVFFTGRVGAWDKHIKVDDVYYQTLNQVKKWMN